MVRIFKTKGLQKIALLGLGLCMMNLTAQKREPRESDYYDRVTLPVPEGMLLEIGGVATLPDGRIAVSTRRGDVYLIENPYMYDGKQPKYKLFASGLHESLGLAYRDHALYTAQRGELTKLIDTNGDDVADVYETVYAWPLSGHYHEYSFGPKITEDGSMFVTANVAFGDKEWWRGESRVPWRGWTMKISPEGEMEPWATGMRSPAGLGLIDGELFYDDNQGDWMGSGAIWRVKKGSFTGHPAGLRWTRKKNSPVKTSQRAFFKAIDEKRVSVNGKPIKPKNVPNEENPLTMYEAKKVFPELTLPAVWLPHGVLGISNSEIIKDETNGGFGPFANQIFVGDQGQSKIMRVVMEEIEGQYQGVAFDFRSGFQSGVLRMNWGSDGSMFVGETNRGWGSAGTKSSGLERLVWTGKMPFEMKTVKAKADGFEIEFTKPVDKKTAENLNNYEVSSFIYKYFSVYGSPPIKNKELKIKGVKVSADGTKVRMVIDGLREPFIHLIKLAGVKDKEGNGLLHTDAYYTLNVIPKGDKLPLSELSTKRYKTKAKKVVKKKKVTKAKKVVKKSSAEVSEAAVSKLLQKYTCTACHNAEKRQVGPAFKEIAKRRYTNERIVQLIYNPDPQNWPDYSTPMAPMPQVPREDALKIAAYINSLRHGD